MKNIRMEALKHASRKYTAGDGKYTGLGLQRGAWAVDLGM